MMGVYRQQEPYVNRKECHECGEKFKKNQEFQELAIYDDPWLTKPSTVRVHVGNDDGNGDCLDKLTDTGWADFRYFVCEDCERMIISQCPSNGWRSYYKIRDGQQVCIKCYQDEILKNGIPGAEFADGHIPGDFFNESDLKAAKWHAVEGFDYCHIAGEANAKSFCNKALELIKAKKKVLVDYRSMGIGGSEGNVSLYTKGV
jgi:hypothetical protein